MKTVDEIVAEIERKQAQACIGHGQHVKDILDNSSRCEACWYMGEIELCNRLLEFIRGEE